MLAQLLWEGNRNTLARQGKRGQYELGDQHSDLYLWDSQPVYSLERLP